MPYDVKIIIRIGKELDIIALHTEKDTINEAIEEASKQVNGLISKREVETILIQKVK